MVLESHPGVARRVIGRLTAAGHAVHRCHEPGAPEFPCNGLAEGGGCPLEGPLDAAVVVRRGVVPRPTPGEDGVICALRAGVPVVEDGSDLLDPYAPFLTARVWNGDEVGEVVERAVADATAPLEHAVGAALVPLLVAAGHRLDAVAVHAAPRGRILHLHLDAPGLEDDLCSRLSVKAADTVRSQQRRWDGVEVSIAT